jgi:hypothetical protein
MRGIHNILTTLIAAAPLYVLAACAPADYTDGITAFSNAVSKANSAEQTLITTYQQHGLDREIARAGQGSLALEFPNVNACSGYPGPYHAGDCAVKIGGQAVGGGVTQPASLASLTKYAALLSSVTTDKTCASLTTDAKGLATAIGDIAKSAGDKAVATPAGVVETIVATVGCIAIDSLQLKILRQATADANPVIKQLVQVVADKDQQMQATTINASVNQLRTDVEQYQGSHSAADLTKMIALAQAIDQAQLAPPGPVILKLADLHQSLTDDLASPTVSLKRVQSDAQALIGAATQAQSAIGTLANPSAAKSGTTGGS